jgi:hypothetical protein
MQIQPIVYATGTEIPAANHQRDGYHLTVAYVLFIIQLMLFARFSV